MKSDVVVFIIGYAYKYIYKHMKIYLKIDILKIILMK